MRKQSPMVRWINRMNYENNKFRGQVLPVFQSIEEVKNVLNQPKKKGKK